MRFSHLPCFLIAAALTATVPLDARAQSPVKAAPRILVGFTGGTVDIIARTIADSIKEHFGEVVIVEARPGASGRVAAEALKRAAPDGRTLLMSPAVVHVLAPLVFKRLNYDPAKDFAPVAHIARFEFAFAVTTNHSARSVREFLAWVQAHPKEVSYGTPAAGSFAHFFGVMVSQATGIEMVHIPYNGSAPLAADLMGGQITASIDTIFSVIELHRAGRIRIIATSGAERSALLPAVPTFKEQGFPAVQGSGWIAVYAPAKTPKPVIDQLSTAIVKAMRTPGMRKKFSELGLEPTGTTPEELAAIMAADTARWAPIIKASGFTAE